MPVRVAEADLPSLFMTGGYTMTSGGMYVYEKFVGLGVDFTTL